MGAKDRAIYMLKSVAIKVSSHKLIGYGAKATLVVSTPLSAEGGANVVGATGVGGEAVEVTTKVVSTGAGVTTDICKKKNI